MPIRTYIPGLRLILKAAHRFGTRYQTQLQGSLTGPQYTCLLSTLAAIADCLVLLGEETPGS
jgi:hypothetical protein